MEPASPNNSPPSTPASSTRHNSLPRRNSTEDGNPSVTRKRPRLDSGERAHQNITTPFSTISAEVGRADSDPTTTDISPATSTLPGSTISQHQDQAEATVGAASKVTLNLRDHLPAHTSALPPGSEELGTEMSPGGHSSPMVTDNIQPQPLDTTEKAREEEIMAAPGDSPNIEVAEPEDMDSPQEETIWKSSLEHELLVRQRELLDTFPLCDGDNMGPDRERGMLESLKAAIVSETGGVLASLLKSTATWIRQYLLQTQQDSRYWPALLSHESAFWHAMSGLLRFLLDDSLYTAPCINPDLASGSANLDDLLSAFTALTARMVASDLEMLQNTEPSQKSSDIKLMSAIYCQALRRVLVPRSDGLSWSRLNRLGIDFSFQVSSFACGTETQRSLLCELANMLSPLLAHSCLNVEQSKLLQRFLVFPAEVFDLYQANYHTPATHEAELVWASFQEFFDITDAFLRSAIKKQSPSLTNEALAIICYQLLVFARSKTTARSLLVRFNLDSKYDAGSLSVSDQISLAEAMWKIDVTEKCVREGRMEIRIAGLDMMQNCLIDIYKQFISNKQPSDASHPIVECISDRLLENKLVEYLLSVDSHPQIISRSGNVVGFLAVSGRWTDEQTNSIWHSIQKMEDLRACETIIDMLPQVTKYLNRTDHEHFIKRMLETPVSRFDLKTLNLLLGVVSQLVEPNSEHEEALTVAISAFASLLRKASADPSLSLSRKNEIWSVVHGGFQNLATSGWPRSSRWEVYRDCFQDLKAHSTGTSGSCATIRRLLERYGYEDLASLVDEFDAVELVLADYARLGDIKDATGTDSDAFMPPVEDRLRILELVIYHLPGSITDRFTSQLWTNMFADHMGLRAREAAWDFLARIATSSKSPNLFLDKCIADQIPSLDARLCSRSTLSFANCICDYERRISQRSGSDNNATPSSITSIDLFWRLASSAEDDQVSHRASQALVEWVQELSKLHSGIEQELFYIDKCISQVIECGNKVLQASTEHDDESAIAMWKRDFLRAYNMLTQFLSAVKHHSPGSPSNRSESQSSESSIAGERVQIQYTTNDRGVASSVKSIEIMNHARFDELLQRLQLRTGFSKFNVICGGQRLDKSSLGGSTVEDLGLHRKGMLILHRVPGSELLNTSAARKTLGSVKDVVLRRFDELSMLLSADALVADRVLTMLRAFEPHPDIIKLVSSEESSHRQILPLTIPHQAIYSLHAIYSTQKTNLQDGMIDYKYMQHSLRIMTAALFELDLPLMPSKMSRPYWLPTEILRCILHFLKEPVPGEISRAYFPDSAALISKLYEITNMEDDLLDPESFALLQSCFSVLLETSRLNESAWNSFSTNEHGQTLFKRLILVNPELSGRNVARQTVGSMLTALSGPEGAYMALDKDQSSPNAEELRRVSAIRLFWLTTCTVIPSAVGDLADRSQQLFSLALNLFRAIDDQAWHVTELQSNLKAWIGILRNYKPQYVVTHDVTEWTVKGLGDLIHEAMLVLKRKDSPLNLEPGFFAELFESLLFPPVLDLSERQTTEISASVLGSQTRAALYRIILRAAVDCGGFMEPISLLNQVLDDQNSQVAPTGWNFDRTKHLRAPAGYPGLENLSNTCYLNSLLTQLFMNPRFREFILTCEIVDERSQALLFALQHLFASMQDGWQKAVNTKDLADAIETYDGPLDPTLQMDADEAFNLLFDRLESQLTSPDSKSAFRKLYGGQLIQQIKSKECDHVSERFEPVTAIQCDIQGKRNLLQSLQAYIEGETMEGDNKYKCSKCDRYVNAVKRACLKELPDNLIFHLKRFDFDLMTGMRNKVNDHFSFPEVIDMAPYTVEYLEGGNESADSDQFVLVGVLVHNGTAELGHYYSYIRERPSSLQSWIEFNDADVTQFEITTLADQCFGGQPEGMYQPPFPKTFNAYMLFYQRRSSIKVDQEHFGRSAALSPIKVHVKEELASQMAYANEGMARIYSLFGPEHANFVRDILAAFLKARGSRCSDDHVVEDAAIYCAWVHLERVFGKEIKRQGSFAVLEFLSSVVATCAHCCSTVIDALISDGSRLRSLFLRLLEPELRIKVGSILIQALKNLKIHMPDAYTTGSEHIDLDMDGEFSQNLTHSGKFATVASQFYELVEVAPLNFRAWFEFYNFLAELALLGHDENVYMHRLGFLQHALKTLSIEPQHDWSSRYHDSHQHYIRLVEKRTYNLIGVVRLIVVLLQELGIDGDDESFEDSDAMVSSRDTITQYEMNLLVTKLKPEGGDKRVPWILERAAAACDTTISTNLLEQFTGLIVRSEPLLRLESSVIDLISYGLVKNPAELAAPYLNIAAAFILTSASPHLIELAISLVVDGTKTIGETGGMEHLGFFRRMLNSRNDVAYPDQPSQIIMATISKCPVWGLALLEYPEVAVAERCAQLLRALLFEPTEIYEQDEEEVQQVKLAAAAEFWNAICDRVQKYVRENRALDEAKRSLLTFYEQFLQQQDLESDATEDSDENVSRYRTLLAQATDLITPSEDVGSNGYESDELTDVSSTYGSPGIEEIS